MLIDKSLHVLAKLSGTVLNAKVTARQSFIKAQSIAVSVALTVSIIVSFCAVLIYAGVSRYLALVHVACGLFFIAAYLYARAGRNPVTVTRMSSFGAFVAIMVVNYAYGGVGSPALAWIILPAVASALILGWRDCWFWIAAACIAVSAFYLADHFGALPPPFIDPKYFASAAYCYLIAFSIVLGALISFSVARHAMVEAELTASLAKSEHDTFIAKLFAESAVTANGSMRFEEAAPICLSAICEAKHWYAANIWRADEAGGLRSSNIICIGAGGEAAGIHVPERCPPGASAQIARDTAMPIVGVDFAKDPRFHAATEVPAAVLAWPLEVDGRVDLVLEFFSRKAILLDEEVRTILRHVAVQLAHVRLRDSVQDRTELMAFTDVVTGLPNRTGFEHLFTQKLKEARRTKSRMALMFIDLDGFKRVNDSLGHATGDRLLKTVGKRLEEHVRESDLAAKLESSNGRIAARLGGDEFTLVLADVADTQTVASIARRFLDVLSQPIDVGFQDVTIDASIGIAMYPDDGKTLSDLMRLADAAMYEAKAVTGNEFRFATPALNDAIQRRLWLETELQKAIRRDELNIAYAPIVAAMSGRVIANEVVLRWPHRDGEIAFAEFFPVAESSGLITELSSWVIEKSCAAIADRRWRDRERPKICLDISLLQLQQPQFVASVQELLRRYDCSGASLEFEFSDTAAILRNEACRKNIRALHGLGIRIVLDRFGTGYSSLSDFAELPVWRVKLDRKFVESVNFAGSNRSMGRAIIAMAHSMGIETTVFGVTTAAQATSLRELGADALQGHYVGAVSGIPSVNVRTRPTRPALPGTDIGVSV